MISEKKDNQIWTCYDLISPNPNINELRLIEVIAQFLYNLFFLVVVYVWKRK